MKKSTLDWGKELKKWEGEIEVEMEKNVRCDRDILTGSSKRWLDWTERLSVGTYCMRWFDGMADRTKYRN